MGLLSGSEGLLQLGNLRLNHYSGEETSHFAWDGINETVLFGEMGIEQDRTQNNDAVYDNSVDFFRQPHTELVVSTTLPDNSQLDATLFQVSGRGYYESFKPDSDPFVYGLDLDVDGVDLVNRRWIHKDQLGLILENKRALGKGELHLGLNGYLFSGEHFGEVIMTETTPVTQPQRYYLHETDKSKLGAHARLNWPLAARLSVEAGLGVQMLSYQLEQKSRGNFTASMLNRFTDDHVFLNPGLGLSWQYSRKLSLHASLSQSHREPSRGEYWNAWEGPDDLGVTPMFSSVKTLPDGSQEWSDPIIDPEQMLDLEVGMQWRSEKHLLGVNLYWLDMQDEIVNFGGVDEESPVKGNAPRSHHAGLELSGQWQTLDWLNMGGNAAFSENKIDELTVHDVYYGSDWSTSTVSRDFSGNSIALSPDLVANFWLEFDLPYGVRLRPSLQHVGEQFLDNSNDDGFVALHPDLVEPGYLDDSGSAHFSKTIDAYTLLALDARLSLRELFNQDLELHLHVENLLDTEYETGGYWNDWVESNADWLYEPQRALYPGAKRNWMLSVNWSF